MAPDGVATVEATPDEKVSDGKESVGTTPD